MKVSIASEKAHFTVTDDNGEVLLHVAVEKYVAEINSGAFPTIVRELADAAKAAADIVDAGRS